MFITPDDITLFDGNGEKNTIKENEEQTKNGKRVPAFGAKMAYHCVIFSG